MSLSRTAKWADVKSRKAFCPIIGICICAKDIPARETGRSGESYQVDFELVNESDIPYYDVSFNLGSRDRRLEEKDRQMLIFDPDDPESGAVLIEGPKEYLLNQVDEASGLSYILKYVPYYTSYRLFLHNECDIPNFTL